MAASSFLSAGAVRANTELDVSPTAITPANANNAPALNTPSTYVQNTGATTTSDVTFLNQAYLATQTFYSNPNATGSTGALSIGSLNDLSATQLTIKNQNGGTQAPTTLFGGDSVSGNTSDLIYVAAGGNLTIIPGGTVSLVLGAAGNFDAVGVLNIGAAVTGNSSLLTKTGIGDLVMSGNSTYNGGTAINAGVLTLGSAAGLGTSGTISFGGGTFQYGTGITTDLSSRFSTAGNQNFRFDPNGQIVTLASPLTGAGSSLTTVGTGTLTLTGASTYTGATNVNAGTLAVTGNTTANASISSSSALSLGGGTLSYAPAINGTASTGATQTFASTQIAAGNSAAAASAGNTVALGAITRTAGATVNFNPGGQTTGAFTGSATLSNGLLGTYATYSTYASAFGLVVTRYATISNGTLTGYSGTGISTASAATDTTGTVNYEIGGGGTGPAGDAFNPGVSFNTLRAGYGIGGGVIGGAFTANGILQAGLGPVTFTGAVTPGANREFDVVSNNGGVFISGAIGDSANGASSLVFGGPGASNLYLSGNNTYTGGTTVNAGTVTLNSAGALGSTGTITLNGGTLQFSANNTTDYSSRLATTANQTFSFDTNGQNVTLASNLTSAGGLFNKVGAGTLTLNGANTFGNPSLTFNYGAANANVGSIVLGTGTALGQYGTIAEPGGTGTSTIALASTGSGNAYTYNLSVAGGRTGVGLSPVILQNLSGNNTFNGAVTITSTTAGSNFIESDAGTLTLNGVLSYAPSSSPGHNFTFTGAGNTVVNGTFFNSYLGLVQEGTGTTTFTAPTGSSFNTGLTVIAGTAAFTGNTALSATFGSPMPLALGGGTLSYAPAINGVAQTGKTLTFNTLTVNAGSSAVNAASGNTVSFTTMTRNTGGIVDFNPTGTGTITTTTNTLVDSIYGPYAAYGSGTGLSYATTTSGSSPYTVSAYTAGTSVANATGVTSTAGTVNYNVAAGGAVGTGASVNTLRYMGAADTVTGPITLNGLMHAGTGALTVNGAVTVGANSELVVISNGQNVTINGAIGNNGSATSALTFGGSGTGTLTLAGTNTYTGATYVNVGTLLNNGAIAGAVNVGTGGTLGSTSASAGTVTGLTTVGPGGRITGGTSSAVGALTLSGGLTLSGVSGLPANYLVSIVGSSSDHLAISGALTLDSTTIGASETLTFSGTPTAASYDLANYTSETGAFTVTNLPAGYALSYGTNELDLVATTVPEPTTALSGLLMVGALGGSQRRRLRSWLRLSRAA